MKQLHDLHTLGSAAQKVIIRDDQYYFLIKWFDYIGQYDIVDLGDENGIKI